MRFAYDFSRFGVILVLVLCALVVCGFAAMLIWSSYARHKAAKRFGDLDLVQKLETFDATARRAWKGSLLVLAMACAFAALSRPQGGKGEQLIPATNLDVVIVLDYSKSMYAQDIVPSRIARAKAEVARMVKNRDLFGTRFGAVAFAGEPIAFPLTADSTAVAKFFEGLTPNDMPIGGTATARALEKARELLHSDPKAKSHARVIVLVTDGEDTEGDPKVVAQKCAEEKTSIHVVQIGGRAPERIPTVGEDGRILRDDSGKIVFRREPNGQYMTTELTADGEAQLAKLASMTSGSIVRSERGETGIDAIAAELVGLKQGELREKTEKIYDELYGIPLLAAIVFFFIEAAIGEAPFRRRVADASGGPPSPRGAARRRAARGLEKREEAARARA